MNQRSWAGLALAAPALAIVVVFFVGPLAMSAILAFRGRDGGFTTEHFEKAFELYSTDLLFSAAIVVLATSSCCGVVSSWGTVTAAVPGASAAGHR